MRFFDLLRLIFGNLNRRKGRVALTAVGVVIGTAAVVILVSLAIGLQQNANQQLYGIGDLTQIQVMPGYGGEAGPGVAIAVGAKGGGGGVGSLDASQPKLLTNEAIAGLAAIPGVERVVPREYFMGSFMLEYQDLDGGGNIIGMNPEDMTALGIEAQQGQAQPEKGKITIGVMVPNNFYDPQLRPGQDPPPPPDLFDKDIKLTLMKWDDQGNQINRSLPVHVVGVLSETRGEPDWSIYMRLEDLKAYNEWAMGRRINYNKDGYGQVVVKVADPKNVMDISQQITDLGYQAYTPAEYVQGINNFYLALQVIFGGVGAIALLVAAIGIANTMAMAILERTREIGLMKAIGATNRDVLSIFLGEAAGIGFIGGVGGVVIGWLVGQIGNVLALVYFAGQSTQQGAPPPSVAIVTPPWLPLFALLFATFIGLISGLYPALRAATMVPVNALKYE
jgi:putative ABC transport system permease protein